MGGSMSSVIITGDTSGAITLAAPTVAGTNTITLPANTGTAITTASTAVVTQTMLSTGVAGSGPIFSAVGAGVSTNSGTKTKIPYTSTNFQSGTTFDTTNYRFLPNVAGYYQINASVQYQGSTNTSSFTQVILYKNGTQYCQGSLTAALQYTIVSVSDILYLNGSTDYVEVWAQQNVTNSQTIAGIVFSGSLIRGA